MVRKWFKPTHPVIIEGIQEEVHPDFNQKKTQESFQ